jgi:hypothetical protein
LRPFFSTPLTPVTPQAQVNASQNLQQTVETCAGNSQNEASIEVSIEAPVEALVQETPTPITETEVLMFNPIDLLIPDFINQLRSII